MNEHRDLNCESIFCELQRRGRELTKHIRAAEVAKDQARVDRLCNLKVELLKRLRKFYRHGY